MSDVRLWTKGDSANGMEIHMPMPAPEATQETGSSYAKESKCNWVCVDRPLRGPICYCRTSAREVLEDSRRGK